MHRELTADVSLATSPPDCQQLALPPVPLPSGNLPQHLSTFHVPQLSSIQTLSGRGCTNIDIDRMNQEALEATTFEEFFHFFVLNLMFLVSFPTSIASE